MIRRLALVALLSGCASGPQLPVTMISLHCEWHAPDGGSIQDSDCMQDRTEAQPSTTGNAIHDNTITPQVSTSVVPH